MQLQGIHHVTAITGDAPRNVEFYAGTLGLRLVKRTVNQDDPTVYHLFYADEEGSPGSDLTFFEYPGARPGRAGDGMVHTVVWRVGSPEAIAFWEQRLATEGVAAERDGDRLAFSDPEGLRHVLEVYSGPERPLVSAAPDVPAEHALQGFAAVRAYAADPEASADLLAGTLGFERLGDGHWRVAGDERSGELRLRRAAGGTGRAGGVRRGHGPSRRLRHEDGGPGGLAGARRAVRAAPHAGDRPLLVPLGLLPRAVRRALRARHPRPGLRDRRGPGAPGRAPGAAARLRAPARRASSRSSRPCRTRAPSAPARRRPSAGRTRSGGPCEPARAPRRATALPWRGGRSAASARSTTAAHAAAELRARRSGGRWPRRPAGRPPSASKRAHGARRATPASGAGEDVPVTPSRTVSQTPPSSRAMTGRPGGLGLDGGDAELLLGGHDERAARCEQCARRPRR